MDLTKLLNNPENEPRRRPRPSFSTQNSQSPAAEFHRHSSIQTSTPVSPPASSSAHGSTHQGYFDRQPSALPGTPSSPYTRNPLTSTPHSLHPHAPIDAPNSSTQSQSNTVQSSPHREVSYRMREESLSVSPKTIVTNLPSHLREVKTEQSSEPRAQQVSGSMNVDIHSAQMATHEAEIVSDGTRERHTGATQVSKVKRPLEEDSESNHHSAEVEPPIKRQRITEIPIWARPAKKLKPLPKYSTNDNTSKFTTVIKVRPQTQPEFGYDGPLGPFEESFRGDFIPHEEVTKQICDFLYHHVVMNDSIGTSKVGEAAKVEGQLEIEAKIGTIIDKNTKERLELPITSESILRQNFDVAFESMMTEQQHRSFNDLLNAALKDSHGPPVTAHRSKPAKPRIHMNYEHRHEVDTFYELPAEEVSNLPQSLQSLLKSGSSRQPTVRVTRHQKTGKILAKIVKARISDLHVSSPSTRFDWRVSVSLEANWDGDLEALIQASTERANNQRSSHPDRHKNRLSYSHLFCQIDLTQVKAQETKDTKGVKGFMDVTHELEVELDSSVVREQGQLVTRGMDNQYQELVKAFVDNVRILVRGVQ